jgi:hypothetical protein
VVYNGALASLLRGSPRDPLLVARSVADALVPDDRVARDGAVTGG